MIFYKIHQSGLSINTYVVADEKSLQCVVIDPTRNIDEIIAICDKKNLQITAILETHVHADFISGAHELRAFLQNKAEIYGSAMGGPHWIPEYVTKPIFDGNSIVCGDLKFVAVHTPGHTPEHLSWALYEIPNDVPIMLFTGDFLFYGGIGRPDLLGKEAIKDLAENLYHSVFEILLKFPDSLKIFPSHGMGSFCGKINGNKEISTLEIEKKENQFLHRKEKNKWVNDVLTNMPSAPDYFFRVKKQNLKKPSLFEEIRKKIQEYPLDSMNNILILDPRNKEAFEVSHIKKSINIPFNDNFVFWSALLLNETTPIVIINTPHLESVIKDLLLVGIENIIGFINEDSHPRESSESLTAEDLKNSMQDYTIIDVRSLEEWEGGHIEEALHMPLNQIVKGIDIDLNQKIAVICKSGFRANMAASWLKSRGFLHVWNVQGGMDAWKRLKKLK